MKTKPKCKTCNIIPRKIDKNENCKACNLAIGLKQCSRCAEIQLFELNFYNTEMACRRCLGFKGIGGGRWPKMPESVRMRVIDAIKSGKTGVEVAIEFDCTTAMVSKVLKEAGLKNNQIAARTYPLDEDFFEKIDTEDKAYFLGLITTDGCVHRNMLIISLQERDRHILEELQKAVKTTTPIKTKTGKRGYKNSKPQSRFEIFSGKIFNDLGFLGVHPNKTFTIKPWFGDKELQRHYWRGCVDGDGSVLIDKNKRTTLSLAGNLEIVTAFKAWVNTFFPNDNKIRPTKSIYVYSVNGINALTVARELYKNSTVKLNRKYLKYLELETLYSSAKCPSKPGTAE